MRKIYNKKLEQLKNYLMDYWLDSGKINKININNTKP